MNRERRRIAAGTRGGAEYLPAPGSVVLTLFVEVVVC